MYPEREKERRAIQKCTYEREREKGRGEGKKTREKEIERGRERERDDTWVQGWMLAAAFIDRS